MTVALFEFVEDDRLPCHRCAARLRRELGRVCGIEDVRISVRNQRIAIAHNPVFLDADTLGERLAELGHVVRPVPRG